MKNIKEMSFETLFFIIGILAVITIVLNKTIPNSVITYIFDTILCLIVLLGAGGMIVIRIKNLIK